METSRPYPNPTAKPPGKPRQFEFRTKRPALRHFLLNLKKKDFRIRNPKCAIEELKDCLVELALGLLVDQTTPFPNNNNSVSPTSTSTNTNTQLNEELASIDSSDSSNTKQLALSFQAQGDKLAKGSTGKMGGSSYFDTRKCSTTRTKGPSFT
ncbi:hypothetical protein CMV_024848 [Castanea mollissima]|uniref:Uncharacterized protein n=1 Tax=Castanea mollissima TaxID=60419 RepID=A0A8J4QH98_9ROSI|nr:hypothetical protein CMV_024848 [Castanea mollissima]